MNLIDPKLIDLSLVHVPYIDFMEPERFIERATSRGVLGE
jgi:hypothetical protein